MDKNKNDTPVVFMKPHIEVLSEKKRRVGFSPRWHRGEERRSKIWSKS